MHREFRAIDHGRGDSEFPGLTSISRVQRGEQSAGKVRREALQQLDSAGIPSAGLRSKSWDEFAAAGSPKMDFIFTVCDNAAREVCPVWPGQPTTAHWGVADPAAIAGTPPEIERGFREAFTILDRRITLFLSLPFGSIGKMALKREVERIGRE